jgi:DNA-binding MarR family transcriptional regulator
MNEVLMALERRGYVRRSADPAHGRVMRTELTRAGARVLAACDRAVDELERRMLGDLDGKAADEIRTSLLALARVLEHEQVS